MASKLRTALFVLAVLASRTTTSDAPEWCGFVDKEHAIFKCGYSSLTHCKQAMADKSNAYCIADPYFAAAASAVMQG